MSEGIWPKILLIGKNGQIGWELNRCLLTLGDIVAVDYPEIDLARPDTITRWVRDTKPNLIVNAAAYTAVDQAEDEPEIAMAVNGTAPGILAEEAKRINAVLVHYSTDYVFDGRKRTPYTEEDEPNPLNVYGRTKLAGERAIQQVGCHYLILRTSWVYGMRGKNFLLTILKLAEERDEIRVVDDQIGTPNWSRWIAQATSHILCRDPEEVRENSGLYHLSAKGETSWCGFAAEIMKMSNLSRCRVTPITTAEYPSSAARPACSILECNKVKSQFGIYLCSWCECLEKALLNVHTPGL